MAESKSLAIPEPTLPGLLSNRTVTDIIGAVKARYEGGTLIAKRFPNQSERIVLQKRREELDHALRPIGDTQMGLMHLRSQIVTRFLTLYPILAHADIASMVESYSNVLSTVPEFAIVRAFKKIINGTATIRDKKGNVVPLDPNEPPGAIYIRQLAMKETEAANSEIANIDKVLTAKKCEPQIETSPEARDRISHGFDELLWQLAQGFRADNLRDLGLSPDASTEAEQRAIEARRRDERERAEKQSERMILDEYQAKGLTPVYTEEGQIISPGLVHPSRLKKTKGKGS